MPVGDHRDAHGFAVLTRDDCMRLLERGGVGRIAVPGERVPTMRPVNFALQHGRIVMRTADGALWAAANAKVGASFEFDEIRNEDHRAWNVIVTGELEGLGAAGEASEPPVKVWAPPAIMERRLLRHGEFDSVDHPADRIIELIKAYNRQAKPFRGTFEGRPLKVA